MKTLLAFTGGFATAIIVVFVLTAWQQKPLRKDRARLKPGLVKPMSQQKNERDTTICHDCATNAFKEVPLWKFFQDVARYKGTHAKDVNKDMDAARIGTTEQDPSLLCMYTLDTLKKFICFIETYAKKAGMSSRKDQLGINFYYAVYPMKEMIHGQEYGSLHTLYLVPTYYNPEYRKQIPFDVKRFAREKEKNSTLIYPLSLDSLHAINPNEKVFIMNAAAVPDADGSSGDVIINQGQLCPPACKDVSVSSRALHYRD